MRTGLCIWKMVQCDEKREKTWNLTGTQYKKNPQPEEIQYPDSLSPASYLHTDSDWFSDVGRTESRIYRES